MARGRFITNGITSDKKINDLSDDTSRLAFTWLVTFADCEGRTHGDPAMVRSMIFPRRTDITIERMEEYIAEWQAAGLVRVYTANGDTWIDFPNFSKHQAGLRKDHEAASTIPPFKGVVTTPKRRSKDVPETPQIKLSISEDQHEDQDQSGAKKNRARDYHFENLATICRLNPPGNEWAKMPKSASGQVNRFVKELKDIGVTEDQITLFGEWWNQNDWRGRQGQPPKPADVVKNWPLFQNGVKTNGNGTTKAPQQLGGMLGAIARRQGAQHE